MERITRNKYVGLRSILVLLSIIFGIFSGWTQNVPLVLSNFRIENNNKSRVYFDRSEPILDFSSKEFKVPVDTGSQIIMERRMQGLFAIDFANENKNK